MAAFAGVFGFVLGPTKVRFFLWQKHCHLDIFSCSLTFSLLLMTPGHSKIRFSSCPLYPSECNNHPDGSWKEGSCSCSFEVSSFVTQQSACLPHGLGAYPTCSSPLLPFSKGFVVFPMFAWSFYFIFRPLPSLKSTIYWIFFCWWYGLTLPCQDLALVVVSTLQLLSSITRLVCWV